MLPNGNHNVCVWCLQFHDTLMLLCPEHEELARKMLQSRGLAPRPVLAAREEPSD